VSGYRTTYQMAKVVISSWGLQKHANGPSGTNPKLVFSLDGVRDPCGEARRGKQFEGAEDGRLLRIREWMMQDARVQAIVKDAVAMSKLSVEGQKECFLSIGVVDQHGKWGSVAVAELIADACCKEDLTVCVDHIDLLGIAV